MYKISHRFLATTKVIVSETFPLITTQKVL
jgi:hypothetical protein